MKDFEKSISEHLKTFSDEDLEKLAGQVSRFYDNAADTNEEPLKSMIENYYSGSSMGKMVVPTVILRECTNRWIAMRHQKASSEEKQEDIGELLIAALNSISASTNSNDNKN